MTLRSNSSTKCPRCPHLVHYIDKIRKSDIIIEIVSFEGNLKMVTSTPCHNETFCQKYFESRNIPQRFEQPIIEDFFKSFIEDHFSWAHLFKIMNGGHAGFYTEEKLFEDIDRAGFSEAWSVYADKLNTRRHRGNCLQAWCLPRRLFLFWSE